MADSSIEWTDKVWNPVVGCTRVSAGCEHCYAERLAHRLALMGQAQYAGLTRKLPNGEVRWTGKAICLPERLDQPLNWRKPARIFVNSMSDLFHEDVPDEFINQCFAVMAMCEHHTFQILTKRPGRMLASAQRLRGRFELETPYLQAVTVPGQLKARTEAWWAQGATNEYRWPLSNVWLGVSVEDQRSADERIPLLRQTPAAVRFLSCEPLLGPIDLWNRGQFGGNVLNRNGDNPSRDRCVDWVIAGGESGPGYRPMDLAWIRSLRDQCRAAGIAFFAKQDSGPRTHMWLPEDLQSHEFPEPAREVAHA